MDAEAQERSPASTCCGAITCELRGPSTGSLSHSARKTFSPLDERELRHLPLQLMEGASRIVWRRPLHFADEEGVPCGTLGHDVDLQRLAIQAGVPTSARQVPRSCRRSRVRTRSPAPALPRSLQRGVENWRQRPSRQRRAAGPPAASDRVNEAKPEAQEGVYNPVEGAFATSHRGAEGCLPCHEIHLDQPLQGPRQRGGRLFQPGRDLRSPVTALTDQTEDRRGLDRS